MIFLILASVFLGALGQILVKIGATNLELNFAGKNLIISLISIMRNLPVMCGIFSYGVSFLMWIKVLSKVELSYAYPMVSIGYVLIMIFSYFVLKENIGLIRIIGVFFIIIGVVLVAKS